jgi:hypothetical protein
MPPEQPIDAVEWKEPAPEGGSQAQIFRLADGRTALVKFAENDQGPLVLFNEFVSCRLAQRLGLPINHSVLVQVDAAVLTIPQRDENARQRSKRAFIVGSSDTRTRRKPTPQARSSKRRRMLPNFTAFSSSSS